MIVLARYDPRWPDAFTREAARLAASLGDAQPELHHIGSTAVPGLEAKPVIDILAIVPQERRLAAECVDDMQCYSEGKTSFIRDIERRAAIWRPAGVAQPGGMA